MFQAEPILWLQSLGSPPLTWLLYAVTLLGYIPVYVVLLLVLAIRPQGMFGTAGRKKV